MKSLGKIFLNASLSSILVTGCICNKANRTLQAQSVDILEAYRYYLHVRPQFKDPVEAYKADLCFVLEYAKKEKKDFFEFDGSTYRTDESALKQVEALITARKSGKKTFIFEGEKKEACSFYDPSDQMNIFGNLWEELISPQSLETKKLIRKCAEKTARTAGSIPFTLNRLYELCRLSGYPEIKDAREDATLTGLLISKLMTKFNTYYSPAILDRPTIYLAPEKESRELLYDDIICELPHAFRNNNNVFGETAQFMGDGIKDILTLTSLGFGFDAQGKNYKNPNRMEYDAHVVVEPLIRKYISSPQMTIGDLYHSIENIRTKNKNTYALTPFAKEKLKEKSTPKGTFYITAFGYKRDISRK